MNFEYALKVGFEGMKFGPGRYGEFSAAPTVDLTMARMDLNRRHVRDLAPISKENNCAATSMVTLAIWEVLDLTESLLNKVPLLTNSSPNFLYFRLTSVAMLPVPSTLLEAGWGLLL